MRSEKEQRVCILRWKATRGLEQKRRMSPSDLHFNRRMLVMENKDTAGRPIRRLLK